MENLRKCTTSKVYEAIKRDPFFKQKCVQKLSFLIDDYEFNQIETGEFGKGSIVIFRKKGRKSLSVTAEYETGVLPTITICLDTEKAKYFSADEFIKTYPIHYKIRQIVQGKISSINNYIKELATIWGKKNYELSEEVDRCLEHLADRAKKFLIDNLEE